MAEWEKARRSLNDHALLLALNQGNWEQVQEQGARFEADFGLFQVQFGNLRDSDRALDQFIQNSTQLLARFHSDAPRLERVNTAEKAIAQFRETNLLFYTQRALSAKSFYDLQRYGVPFAAKGEEFVLSNQMYEDIPVMASALGEVKRTLDAFKQQYPVMAHEDEVRKAISDIKTKNHMWHLETGLNQRNITLIYDHGPKFEAQVDTFIATYGDSFSVDAKQFISQAQALLKRYRTEGPQYKQDQQLDDDIHSFKSVNNMYYLTMALAQKNSANVAQYGPLFEKQFEQFLATYGCNAKAYRFISEGKALLDKYHTEGPVIIWEETVRQKLSSIRKESNIHFLGMGLNQRNLDYIKIHGPKVEQQLEDVIAFCGNNPTQEFNSFVTEVKALVERYRQHAPDVKREYEVRQAISDFRTTNTIHFLDMALNQRNANQMDLYGDRFVQEYQAFMALYEHDKHAASFVREIKALYAKYEKDRDVIHREREVAEAISAFKTTNHMHYLSMALSQKDARQVELHGPVFEELLIKFLEKYGNDKDAQSFVREAKSILERYKKDGPRIKREDEVRQAIAAIKNTNHIHFLTMALNQRSSSNITIRGPPLKELFAEFLQEYGQDPSADSFIRETKALLARYEKEGPDILREHEVKQAISELKNFNEIHFLGMALNQQNAESIEKYGPPLEERFQEFLARYNGDKHALSFIKETEVLLNRYRTQGPKIIRHREVEREIEKIKSKHDMQSLNFALAQKNRQNIEKHGHLFAKQMEEFLAQYGQDANAQAFIFEAKKLLRQFREVCPEPPMPSAPVPAFAQAAAPMNPYGMPSPSPPVQYSPQGALHYSPGLGGGVPSPQPLSAPAPYPGGSTTTPLGGYSLGGMVPMPAPPASAPAPYTRPPIPAYALPPSPSMSSPSAHHPPPSSSCSDPACSAPPPSCCADEQQQHSPVVSPASPFYGGGQGAYPQPSYPSAEFTPSAPPAPLSFPQEFPRPSGSGYVDSSQYFSTPQSGMQLHQQPTPASLLPQIPTEKPSSWSSPSPPSSFSSSQPPSSSSPAAEKNTGVKNSVTYAEVPNSADQSPAGDGYFNVPEKSPAPFSDEVVAKAEGCGENQQTMTSEEQAQEKFREIRFEELQMISKIGSGSYGTVYKAWWRGTIVAVKKLDETTDMSPGMVELFRKEAAAMALIAHHPSLATFVGACCEPPNVCLVSQYYRFGSLESLLRGASRTSLPWKAFVKMAKETAAGIYHLHKEGILHSRIASRNILVGDGCRAYVNDFAFCHYKPKEQVYAQSATQTFLGPVRYMSPEAMLHKYSEGSDAWAFGVLLWELWEKREPFEGDDDLTVAFKVAQDNQTLPLSPSLPETLAKLIRACWQERASQRPPFREILDTLETYFTTL